MTIGQRIKARRETLGMTQEELAKKVGYVSRSSINKIELSRDLPSKKIALMAEALETSPSYLMGWVENADRDYPQTAEGQLEQISRQSEKVNSYLERPLKEALEEKGITLQQMEEALEFYQQLISLPSDDQTAIGTLLKSRQPRV